MTDSPPPGSSLRPEATPAPLGAANSLITGSQNTVGDVHGSAVLARTIHGDVHVHQPTVPRLPRAQQLRPVNPCFVDRREERAQLDRVLHDWRDQDPPGAPLLIVATGAAGVGVTELVHGWLAPHIDRFPDGVLCAEWGSAGLPVAAAEIVGDFLRAMGVEGSVVPERPAARVGLWRSVTANRSLAVVVDHPGCAQDVLTLQPTSPRALTVVTHPPAVDDLIALGARVLPVQRLTDAAGAELFRRYLRDHPVEPSQADAARAARLSRGRPAAVARLAGVVLTQPQHPIGTSLAAFAPAPTPEEITDRMAAQHSSEAVAQAYATLSDPAAAMYRVLGQFPDGPFSLDCAAAAATVDRAAAQLALHALTNALLVQVQGADYRMPSEVREHARSAAVWQAAGWGPNRRLWVLRQILHYYLVAALTAARTIMPARRSLPLPEGDLFPPPDMTLPPGLSTMDGALAWMARERSTAGALITAVADSHDVGCLSLIVLLADAWQPARIKLGWHEWAIEVNEVALAAARELGHTSRIASLVKQLARDYSRIGDQPQARLRHEEELALATASRDRDPLAMVSAVKTGGLLCADVGDWSGAIDAYTRALAVLEQVRSDHARSDVPDSVEHHRAVVGRLDRKEGLLLIKRGQCCLHPSRDALALRDFRVARALLDGLPMPDRYNSAIAVTGAARALTGTQPEQAEQLLRAAWDTMQAEGSVLQQLDILQAWETVATLRHDAAGVADVRARTAALRATAGLP